MGSERVVHSPVIDGRLLIDHGVVKKAKTVPDDVAVSVGTYPIIDAEGDFVEPDGGHWDDVRVLKADWLHDVLVGRIAVEMMKANIDGKDWTLPICYTTFFKSESDLDGFDLRKTDRRGNYTGKSWSRAECVHAAAQAGPLVLKGHAPGVSLEFIPNPAQTSVIGKSLLRGRPAYHYGDWSGRGLAHCPPDTQVNAGAQLIQKALEVARSGRALDGAKLLPVIHKAFVPLLKAHPRPAAVVSGYSLGKSMDYPDDTAPPVDDAAAPEPSDVPPEVSDGTDVAQIVADCAERLKGRAGKTLHKQTRKFYAKLAERWEADLEDLLAHVADVEAEAGGGETESTDDEDLESDDENAEEKDKEEKALTRLTYDDDGFPAGHDVKLERDAAGLLVLKSQYVPQLRLADLKPVNKGEVEASPDPTAAAEFDREYRKLSGTLRGHSRRTSR